MQALLLFLLDLARLRRGPQDLPASPALLILFYGRNSAVARWASRWTGVDFDRGEEAFDRPDPAVDESIWIPERKVALVREIIAGKLTTSGAAREYSLPEAEI